MKNQLLSLGKVLSKETKQKINGGTEVYCVTENPNTGTSSIEEGPCKDNSSIYVREIEM